ncbi:hypothetical protein F1C10_10210 [Sphingomonas sp. NBWT7]|uniref:hypothetical protein n=1 Tax=Sphingomonas sp. NBWT7 TaxID=2596913 RepID=UPI00162AB7B3|nr:hypothetical protein [Sphingomonas sp. NBWT7]QNE32283.1 hypothetical protein F1C10_10210 [Sphingomonas sp. NBWT7]
MSNDLARGVSKEPHIDPAAVRNRALGFVAAGMLTIALAPSANGQTVPAPLAELARCRAISDAGARLACFDKAADAIDAAQTAGTLLPRTEPERPRRLGLGDPVQTGPLPTRAERADQERDTVREINDTVASYRPASGRGMWYIRLANGQLWRTLGGLQVEPRVGGTVRIRTTATGGFRLSINNGTPSYVERVL